MIDDESFKQHEQHFVTCLLQHNQMISDAMRRAYIHGSVGHNGQGNTMIFGMAGSAFAVLNGLTYLTAHNPSREEGMAYGDRVDKSPYGFAANDIPLSYLMMIGLSLATQFREQIEEAQKYKDGGAPDDLCDVHAMMCNCAKQVEQLLGRDKCDPITLRYADQTPEEQKQYMSESEQYRRFSVAPTAGRA